MISVKYWIKYLIDESKVRKLTAFEKYHYRIYKMNYDESIKEVGDVVYLWDTSFLCTGDGIFIDDEFLIKNVPLSDGIIIENNCKFEFITNDDDLHNVDILDKIFLDLLIYFPKLNITVRTHSDFVKVV